MGDQLSPHPGTRTSTTWNCSKIRCSTFGTSTNCSCNVPQKRGLHSAKTREQCLQCRTLKHIDHDHVASTAQERTSQCLPCKTSYSEEIRCAAQKNAAEHCPGNNLETGLLNFLQKIRELLDGPLLDSVLAHEERHNHQLLFPPASQDIKKTDPGTPPQPLKGHKRHADMQRSCSSSCQRHADTQRSNSISHQRLADMQGMTGSSTSGKAGVSTICSAIRRLTLLSGVCSSTTSRMSANCSTVLFLTLSWHTRSGTLKTDFSSTSEKPASCSKACCWILSRNSEFRYFHSTP